jgi:hypothetical protein
VGGRVPDEMRAQLKHIITSESTTPVLMYYLEYVTTHEGIWIMADNIQISRCMESRRLHISV